MKHLLIIISLLALFSCKKDTPLPHAYSKVPIVNIPVAIIPPKVNNFNWCGKKIVWWGDSMTEAWNEIGYAYSPLYYLAQYMKIDTLAYHTDGTGWHYNVGAGDSMLFMEGVSGQTSIQIRDRFLSHPELWDGNQIIWAGKNNAGSTEQVFNDDSIMLSKPSHKRYIIIGVLASSWDYKGTIIYKVIKDLNARLKESYGDHFIDPLEVLLPYANLNSDDTLAIKNDVFPYSLTIDGVHLKDQGTRYIAQAVFDKLTKCN